MEDHKIERCEWELELPSQLLRLRCGDEQQQRQEGIYGPLRMRCKAVDGHDNNFFGRTPRASRLHLITQHEVRSSCVRLREAGG